MTVLGRQLCALSGGLSQQCWHDNCTRGADGSAHCQMVPLRPLCGELFARPGMRKIAARNHRGSSHAWASKHRSVSCRKSLLGRLEPPHQGARRRALIRNLAACRSSRIWKLKPVFAQEIPDCRR